MNKTIELIVSPQGETRLETKGFTGAECQAASQLLEQALGRRTHKLLTSDFFAHGTTSHSQHSTQHGP